ncbi:MAG: energy transducer TonB [Acidobacteriota bacterium]|nr:energy transducer TonB [Acidobacteriota bacterium]
MRSVLVASLLLVPLATALSAHASDSTSKTTCKVEFPDASTGVKDPTLIRTPKSIAVPYHDILSIYPERTGKVDLLMTVDANGHARHIRVAKSTDPFLDDSAIAEAEHLKWKPARLDHHSITDPVKLDFVISRTIPE